MWQCRNTGTISLFILASVLLPLAGGGCVVTSDAEQHRSGNYVADSTFAQIKPGQTTAGWVRATLGEPSRITHVESDGIDLWDYVYTERKESSGAVFLLFGGHDVKETTGHAYVQIKNGIVTNAWRG